MPEPTAIPSGDPAAYELAYVEARRALEDQERTVTEFRSRAGALIAAAAITTSFFGGQTLGSHEPGVAAWVAITSFVFLGACVLAILWPRRDWEFDLNPAQFISTYIESAEEALPLHLIHRDLALHMGRSAALNRTQIGRLVLIFRAGSILLLVEVVAWVVALIGQS